METKQQNNRIKIGTINGSDIFAVKDESGEIFVPIKPICKAIGVAFEPQFTKLKEHPILSSTITLSIMVGADGKNREMAAIPIKYVFGWLFLINPQNVSTEAKPSIMKYQMECYNILYRHFFAGSSKLIEANKAEIGQLEKINDLLAQERVIKTELKEARENLAKIRAARLDNAPSIFD